MDSVVISDAVSSELRGLLVSREYPIGTPVEVKGQVFTVKKCTRVLLSYNGKKNALTVRAGHRYYSLPATQRKFLAACGHSDIKAFMRENMSSPTYVFGFAETYRFFLDLYEPFF